MPPIGRVFAAIELSNPRKPDPAPVEPKAHVDAGAQMSCIPEHVALQLALDTGQTAATENAVPRWADLKPATPTDALVARVDLVVIPWSEPLAADVSRVSVLDGRCLHADPVGTAVVIGPNAPLDNPNSTGHGPALPARGPICLRLEPESGKPEVGLHYRA